MDISANTFQDGVLKTENVPKTGPLAGVDPTVCRLLHSILGQLTEVGEQADILKRHLFYDQPLDLVHMADEQGDTAYYLGIGSDAAGFSLGNVLCANRAKLQVRYGDDFDVAKAAEKARNRKAERLAMLQKLFDGQDQSYIDAQAREETK